MTTHPKVHLAGRTYEIPPLPIKHIRAVLPLSNSLAALAVTESGITKDAVDKLYDACRVMMAIVNPTMTEADYEDLHISVSEIAAALPVFIMQAGLEPKVLEPGEASAGKAKAKTGKA